MENILAFLIVAIFFGCALSVHRKEKRKRRREVWKDRLQQHSQLGR